MAPDNTDTAAPRAGETTSIWLDTTPETGYATLDDGVVLDTPAVGNLSTYDDLAAIGLRDRSE